jgi:hypothetical protein
MLVGSIVATAVGMSLHSGPTEVHIVFDEGPSAGLVLGVSALVILAFGPVLLGACLGLAAVWKWRRLGPSSRLTRVAWALWVLGPVPVLLLPLAQLFQLNEADTLKTAARNVGYILTVTTPALFALLPGTLNAGLVLKRFIPESRAPGQLTLMAAPACIVSYLLPLAVLAQVAFHPGLYVGLLILALSPLVPLLAVRWLLRRHIPNRAAGGLRTIVVTQGAVSILGLALIIAWLGEHPLFRSLLGEISPAWVVGFVAKVLASKWLTTVVVTDLLVSMLHQGRQSAQSLTDTAEGQALAEKLDVLAESLRPAGHRQG